jgi:hypothetical protein
MSEDKDKRKRFIVQISFYIPESGPIQVWATDEAHARELVPKMVPHLKDVQIHDIFSADDVEKHEPPQTAPATPTIN